MPNYIAIPAVNATTWDAIFDYAWNVYGVQGNDFIGSRQYNGSTGNVAFHLYH